MFFSDLFPDDAFISFETLCADHDIPRTHRFRFFQIRSFAQKMFTSYPYMPPKNHLDVILEFRPSDKKQMSMIYSYIGDLKEVTWDKVKTAWERDLGEEFSEEMWQSSLQRIHSSSMCIRHGLIQFKILHRLHYSGEKLARLFNIPDRGCPRCSQTPTSLGHLFWTCPSLENFSRQIFDVLSRIGLSGTEITPSFHTLAFLA